MASAQQNLSSHTLKGSVELKNKKIAIVVSEWNEEVTGALYAAAVDTLVKHGVLETNIVKHDVPGSFELTLAAQWCAEKEDVDAVVCIGCVVQGETKHFDFICDAVAQGVTNVSLKYNKPVIFGVLTPNTQQQALDRAGGKHGNKGDEAAMAAIKMLQLKDSL